jgi:hypothetical protein
MLDMTYSRLLVTVFRQAEYKCITKYILVYIYNSANQLQPAETPNDISHTLSLTIYIYIYIYIYT